MCQLLLVLLTVVLPYVLSVMVAGRLVGVVGTSGFGKSSLLNAILGEMYGTPESGQECRSLRGKVAYVPQKAWIINGSVEDNITFGLPYDKAKFDHAVSGSGIHGPLVVAILTHSLTDTCITTDS